LNTKLDTTHVRKLLSLFSVTCNKGYMAECCSSKLYHMLIITRLLKS